MYALPATSVMRKMAVRKSVIKYAPMFRAMNFESRETHLHFCSSLVHVFLLFYATEVHCLLFQFFLLLVLGG